MKLHTIGYWATTGLFALAMGGGGLADLTGAADEAVQALGYPAYFATILGTWKLLGAVALVAPGFARLKEWAYAGFLFALTGAVASHVLAGDPALHALPPLILLALGAGSYALRHIGREPAVREPMAVAA